MFVEASIGSTISDPAVPRGDYIGTPGMTSLGSAAAHAPARFRFWEIEYVDRKYVHWAQV